MIATSQWRLEEFTKKAKQTKESSYKTHQCVEIDSHRLNAVWGQMMVEVEHYPMRFLCKKKNTARKITA